jgi:hypothetical protein
LPGDIANVRLERTFNPNARTTVKEFAVPPMHSKYLNLIANLRRIISKKSEALCSYDFIAELDLRGLEVLNIRGNL